MGVVKSSLKRQGAQVCTCFSCSAATQVVQATAEKRSICLATAERLQSVRLCPRRPRSRRCHRRRRRRRCRAIACATHGHAHAWRLSSCCTGDFFLGWSSWYAARAHTRHLRRARAIDRIDPPCADGLRSRRMCSAQHGSAARVLDGSRLDGCARFARAR